MDWAEGVVESVDVVGDKSATKIGAKRIINGAIHETLQEVNTDDQTIIYSIDDGPEVLSKDTLAGYRGTIKISPITIGEGTFVEWSSSWENDNPAVADFCDPIYKALLGCLQSKYSN